MAADSEVVREVVERVAASQNEIASETFNTGRLRFVDRLAVQFDPATDLQQYLAFERGDGALARWADVEEIVGATSAAVADELDDLAGRLLRKVVAADAPVEVRRLTHLARDIFRRATAVDRFGVLLLKRDGVDFRMAEFAGVLQTRIVDDHRFGLFRADHSVEFVEAPIHLGPTPVAVKPEPADVAVVCAQDLDRVLQILKVDVELGVVEVPRFLAAPVPVHRRVIEDGHDVFGAAAVDEFANQIASGGRVRRVVVVEAAGVVKREAVVVARRQCDVTHPGVSCESGDRARVEVFGGEGVAEFDVFVELDRFAVLNPFALLELRVEAPVDEHPEGEFLERCDVWRGHRDRQIGVRLWHVVRFPLM